MARRDAFNGGELGMTEHALIEQPDGGELGMTEHALIEQPDDR